MKTALIFGSSGLVGGELLQKLIENKDIKGKYVECGVFMGGTLMSAVNFTKENIRLNHCR